jgi:hypothetical protein
VPERFLSFQRDAVMALKDVTASISEGVTVVAPSACDKSTLVKMMPLHRGDGLYPFLEEFAALKSRQTIFLRRDPS